MGDVNFSHTAPEQHVILKASSSVAQQPILKSHCKTEEQISHFLEKEVGPEIGKGEEASW